MTIKTSAGGYTISVEVTGLTALYTGGLMAEIDRLKERNVTRQLVRDIEEIGDNWLRQKHEEGTIFEPMVSVHAQPAHIILIIGERPLVEEREAALAQSDISLPEPMARVVLELYAAAYSEGQAPEEAAALLGWIRDHHSRLLEDREFSHLPVPTQHPAWRAADLIEQEDDRLLTGTGTAQTPTGLMEAVTQEQLRREPTAPTIGEQWWLAELDRHGNPTLTDGAHSDRAGADRAKYLLDRLGLSRDRRLVVARVTLSEALPSSKGVNKEALGTLNAIGLRPKR